MRVAGFRFASLDAGIRKRPAPDVALIAADRDVPCAAVFTTNRVAAAPVRVARERSKRGVARAVLVNAGCANACTGAPGMRAAKDTTAEVARALGTKPERVLPASTGVIGVLLPAEKITPRAAELVASLRDDGAEAFSRAILTTDRGPKVAHAELTLGRTKVRVLGMAKGAGMIHPNMATTLGFVVTDAALPASLLRAALRDATRTTFDAASVDGDTSTNDTLVLLASGAAGNARATGADAKRFTAALRDVLGALADMIVADGEGAEHLVRIHVTHAPSARAARDVARTIATSPLVKTALHGEDPNWGRIVAAAGRAGVRFDPDRVALRIGDVPVVARGVYVGGDDTESRAHAVMKEPRYAITLSLAAGKSEATYTTCDLGHEYVRINADYRS